MNFKISIVIPAINETHTINETVSHLKRMIFGGGIEIIVVDGHPSRNTVKAVEDESVVKISSPKGRGVQMNAGAKAASGEVLLFLHADTFLPEKAFASIAKAVRECGASAGAFDLGIRSEKQSFRAIEKAVYFRTRVTGIPYGDQAIFVKRRLFENLGGYAEIPIMEDVDLMRRIKKRGEKIAIIPLKTHTSARRWEKEGVVCCTLRNWTIIALYGLGVSPARISRYYR